MPRARIPDASLIASADALILPWLAPRAFAESPVLRRRQRCDGRSNAAQKEQAPWHPRTRTSQSSQPSSSGDGPCRTPTGTRTAAALNLRYADIASFAHRHVRGYATSAQSRGQATTNTSTGQATANTSTDQATANTSTDQATTNTSIARDASSGSRYSRRRAWQDELAELAEGLTPEKAMGRRAELIEMAYSRLTLQIQRLKRNRRRYPHRFIYYGQYRSLRRFAIGLRRWRETTEDVRKDRGIDRDDERWLLRTFAALDRSTYARVHALTNAVTLQHDSRCHHYAQRLLEEVDGHGPERMSDNWQKFGEDKEFYESLLVYMLDKKPGYAQDFITVLAFDSTLPDSKFVILADALAHLAKVHIRGEYPSDQGWETTPAANTRKFISTFLLFTPHVDTDVYSQELLHSLVLLADTADLKRIYDASVDAGMRLSVGTTLHYATAFGEAGEFHYALQSLERRFAATNTERKLAVGSESFRWTCAAILRGSMRKAKNYHETPRIVAAFVELGFKMDLLLYDVVMHNAMDAGDFATAFKVYNALEDNGLVADKYTFSILLHGCTEQSDPAMFKAFADFCVKKAKELNDPWLATECLYYNYVCERNKTATARDMGSIWRTYLDLFDLKPLEPFLRDGSHSMNYTIDQHVADPKAQTLAPTPMALYLMLQTEIQTPEAVGTHYLEHLYRTFKRVLVEGPHATLASLSQTPIIWNAFLYAFCSKIQYASASQVIKDMTAHGTLPNIYSWNTFMQSFFKTGQVAPAERVFSLMRARGVDPDAYTYGVMARGYAKAQLVDRIGETMQHIGDEEQLDPDLLRALGQVQARQDLTVALEKSRIEKETREAEQRERKAREEEKRFETPRFASLLASAMKFRPAAHWDNGDAKDDFLEPDDEPVGAKTEPKDPEEPSPPSQTPRVFKSLFGAQTLDGAAKPLPQFGAVPGRQKARDAQGEKK